MNVTCPHCATEFEVEVVKVKRGVLAGIELADMTDDQLKREITNAKSVLYKATKRGASDELLVAHQDRVDAAMAEKAARKANAVEEVVEVVEVVEAEVVEESPYAELPETDTLSNEI